MAQDAKLQIRLTADEKAKIFRLAARRSLDTGERISASDVLRDLAITALEGNHDSTALPDASKEMLIKFKPVPEVLKALKRASANSGQTTDKVINALIAEALQLETGA